MLGGLRIAGGLSLIGAVVAEIAAGSAGAGSGLAYRIAESGYRLNIPRMFAALMLLSIAGVVIFYVLSLVNYLALRRWHERERARARAVKNGKERQSALPRGHGKAIASTRATCSASRPAPSWI